MERDGVQGNAVVEVQETPASLPVFGHLPFSGTYATRLEASGRLVLPAALRFAFDGSARIRAHRGEYLMLTTIRGFDAVVDHLSAGSGEVLHPRTRKRLYMSAPQVTIDRQSRLVIPPELREQVGLGEDIILAGAIESIEIWPAGRFADAEAPTHDEADLLFDTFTGLPTDPR
jgi:MraZ protein